MEQAQNNCIIDAMKLFNRVVHYLSKGKGELTSFIEGDLKDDDLVIRLSRRVYVTNDASAEVLSRRFRKLASRLSRDSNKDAEEIRIKINDDSLTSLLLEA